MRFMRISYCNWNDRWRAFAAIASARMDFHASRNHRHGRGGPDKHARAYRNIGYRVAACSNFHEESGRRFAAEFGAEFVPVRRTSAAIRRWISWMSAPSRSSAWSRWNCRRERGSTCWWRSPWPPIWRPPRRMIEAARRGGILLGVVSQHRFDDASLFLSRAIPAGRLGKLIAVRLLREVVPFGRSITRAPSRGVGRPKAAAR